MVTETSKEEIQKRKEEKSNLNKNSRRLSNR